MRKLFSTILLSIAATSVSAQVDEVVRFAELPPLSQDDRYNLSVDSLAEMSQEELDQIYAQLSSGPMPEGFYEGTVVFDDTAENDIERMLAILSPKGKLETILKTLGVKLWKGKTFFKDTSSLNNRVGLVNRFPAHVFCGQSLIDARKESIVLDYTYAETADKYNPAIDWAMTRKGLGIRDEIRMVRPGLYLGRAYIHNIFALNFILHQEDAEAQDNWAQNSCRG